MLVDTSIRILTIFSARKGSLSLLWLLLNSPCYMASRHLTINEGRLRKKHRVAVKNECTGKMLCSTSHLSSSMPLNLFFVLFPKTWSVQSQHWYTFHFRTKNTASLLTSLISHYTPDILFSRLRVQAVKNKFSRGFEIPPFEFLNVILLEGVFFKMKNRPNKPWKT